MKELEAENSRLKRMYSELSLENHALKELISKRSDATGTPGSSGVPGGGTGVGGEDFMRACGPCQGTPSFPQLGDTHIPAPEEVSPVFMGCIF